jgi:ubiquinone/menaquinone biosynthesis C-methylase UbiE
MDLLCYSEAWERQLRTLGLFLVVFTAAGTVTPQDGRLFNPRDVDALENDSRDQWQKPSMVVEALQLPPGSAVADIGTGSGYFVPYLSQAIGPSGKLYAVDIQQEMLGFVERKVSELGLTNVTTVLSQENDTRLEPGSVDLALLVDVYYELRSPRELMSNIRRILKPSGRLAIIDFDSEKEIPGIGPPRRHRVAEQRLVKEVRSVGFELAEKHSFLPHQYFLVFTLTEGEGTERR